MPRRIPADDVRPATEDFLYVIGESSLGRVLVASSDRGVVAILFGEDTEELLAELAQRFPRTHFGRGLREDQVRLRSVVAHLADPARDMDFPVDLRGTPFQKKVWQAVRKIPLGRTSTYTAIAAEIGAPRAMRAVGTACQICHLFPIIPCHRVLRADGSLGSFDPERQQDLLEREKEAALRKKSLRKRKVAKPRTVPK